jgi:hypothetical protein
MKHFQTFKFNYSQLFCFFIKFLPPIIPFPSLLCPTTSIGSPFLATPRSTRPVTIVPLSNKERKYILLSDFIFKFLLGIE